jgi:hypothetical protein
MYLRASPNSVLNSKADYAIRFFHAFSKHAGRIGSVLVFRAERGFGGGL